MTAAEETEVKYLTLAQVGEAFGVSEGTAWAWVKSKKLKAKRFPRGTKYSSWRVSSEEVDRVKARLAQGLPL
jgi:predicted DNA-binding transcriptional regulator AlpA